MLQIIPDRKYYRVLHKLFHFNVVLVKEKTGNKITLTKKKPIPYNKIHSDATEHLLQIISARKTSRIKKERKHSLKVR